MGVFVLAPWLHLRQLKSNTSNIGRHSLTLGLCVPLHLIMQQCNS